MLQIYKQLLLSGRINIHQSERWITQIQYALLEDVYVILEVYDISGSLIKQL